MTSADDDGFARFMQSGFGREAVVTETLLICVIRQNGNFYYVWSS